MKPIPTSNRFGVLEEGNERTGMDQGPSSSGTQTPSTPAKETKPPPIIVTSKLNNYETFHQQVKGIVKQQHRIIYNSTDIKVYASTMEDYNNLKKSFTAGNVKYYTFTPKDERTKKLVVKVAPRVAPFTSEAQVKENLSKLNHIPTNCIKMKSHQKDKTSTSFLLEFPKTTNLNPIKKIQSFEDIGVRFEDYIKRGRYTQCYNCQDYGHGAKNCNKPPRCVKCPDHHQTRECKKPHGQPQCCNCGGPHPANYSQCPVFTAYIQKVSNKNPLLSRQTVQPNNHSQISVTNHRAVTPQVSYANVTNTNQSNVTPENPQQTTDNTQHSNGNSFNILLKEINELNNICNIDNLISMIRELKTALTGLTDPLTKIQVITNIAQKYNV